MMASRSRVLHLVALLAYMAAVHLHYAEAASRILHVTSAQWISQSTYPTTANDLQIRCQDALGTSTWASPADLSPDVYLTNGTVYDNSSVGLTFNIGGDFLLLFDTVSCTARLKVNETLRTQPQMSGCVLDSGALRQDINTQQCCEAAWDDGILVTFCMVARAGDGDPCAADEYCHSKDCRRGFCCGELGRVDGCLKCRSGDGACATCAEPYFLSTSADIANRRRRDATFSTNTTFTQPLPPPGPQPPLNFSNPAGTAADLDLGILVAQTCYRDQPAGSTCSRNAQCASGICGENYCCSASLFSSACTNCTEDGGQCGGCLPGYELQHGACFQLVLDGGLCNNSTDCASRDCRSGHCCGTKGSSVGCLSCDYDGECDECDSGFTMILAECFSNGATRAESNNTVSNSTIIIAAVGGGVGLIALIILAVRAYKGRISAAEESE
eukprot:m.66835 g.66835  ORF g.66835 m.66835 type:complete len:442 (-) comp13612_c1_seq1:541-1866(-)